MLDRFPFDEDCCAAPRTAQRQRRTWWSAALDAELAHLVAEHGCKWRLIERLMQHRVSDDALRNRWKRRREGAPGKATPEQAAPEEGAPEQAAPEEAAPGPRKRRAWTDEEDAALTEAILTDDLDRFAGQRPRSAWRNRAHRLGLAEEYKRCTRRRRQATNRR